VIAHLLTGTSVLLASGGRDGCIRIWDIRQPTEDEDDFDALVPYCNNLIQNAHGDKLVRRDPATRTNTKSVTSVAYLEHRDNLIASSGSFESVVKVWDLRKCLSRRINPPALQTSPDFSFRPGVSKKPNGVCSILLSADKTELYAIATNAKCVALDAFDVSRPEPLKTFDTTPWHLAEDWQGSFMTELRTSSFYVRLALSPDGRTLATGTQEGNIWMWDTRNAGRNFNDVHVKGHSGEICGLDFSSQGMISCSDDVCLKFLTRRWLTPKL
jgi:WD40 repeat protein